MGRHVASGRNTARASRPRGHGTVWACAEEEVPAGTGRLASWLLNAVIKVVTTYTAPGDRVLLVEPAPGMRRSRVYGGLLEAVWPVVRLGRGVRAQQIGEIGKPGSSTAGEDDLFDAVIVAAEPDVLMRIGPTHSARVLTPCGVLAVITHAGQSTMGFVDSTAGLVRLVQVDGLRYLDRVVLLKVPTCAVPAPHGTSSEVDVAAVAVWARVHADLHVFVRGDRG